MARLTVAAVALLLGSAGKLSHAQPQPLDAAPSIASAAAPLGAGLGADYVAGAPGASVVSGGMSPGDQPQQQVPQSSIISAIAEGQRDTNPGFIAKLQILLPDATVKQACLRRRQRAHTNTY